ncbi:MAG: radical SAM protein [Nitrospinae bacterium]|nr:radical SAM protein [Nitrospinota bacterium]
MSVIRVSEIFLSIQGESTHAGRPCVFIRLAGCNLDCAYCDTGYAAKSAGEPMEVSAALDKALALRAPLVEVTGGEPLIQPGAAELIKALLDAGLETLVETNGTVDLSRFDRRAKYIVDIKTPGSGSAGSFHEANYGMLRPGDEVKFVVSSREDFQWAAALCRERGIPDKAIVLFSPVWGKTDFAELADWLLASGLNARMNLQLHKIIWGGEAKGV